MSTEKTIKPIIFIDQKKMRIRIHRTTLTALGNPKFVQILVNPKDYYIVIKSATAKDRLAHRVKTSINSKHYSMELYSKDLILKFREVCEWLLPSEQYRISGEIIASESLARFNLKNAMVFNSETEAINE